MGLMLLRRMEQVVMPKLLTRVGLAEFQVRVIMSTPQLPWPRLQELMKGEG